LTIEGREEGKEGKERVGGVGEGWAWERGEGRGKVKEGRKEGQVRKEGR
jgi:hypothetical protein